MIENKVLQEVFKEVAKELKLPLEVVTVAYRSYFSLCKETFAQIPVEDLKSEEDLQQYNTVINIPYFGKFYTNWKKIVNFRTKREKILKYHEEKKIKNEKDNSSIHEDSDNS